MSRGLGKVESKVLEMSMDNMEFQLGHALYYVYGKKYCTQAEAESVRRAIRSLCKKFLLEEVGWIYREAIGRDVYMEARGEELPRKLYGSRERVSNMLEIMARVGEKRTESIQDKSCAAA